MSEGKTSPSNETRVFRENILPQTFQEQQKRLDTLRAHTSLTAALRENDPAYAQKIETVLEDQELTFNRELLKKAKQLLKRAPFYAQETAVRQVNLVNQKGEAVPSLIRKHSFTAKDGQQTQVLETFTPTEYQDELKIENVIFSRDGQFINLIDLVPEEVDTYYTFPTISNPNPESEFFPVTDEEPAFIKVAYCRRETEHSSLLHETGHSFQKETPTINEDQPQKQSLRERSQNRKKKQRSIREKTLQKERNAWAFALHAYRKSKQLGVDLEPKDLPLKIEFHQSLDSYPQVE